jgi:hypothetical protein
MHGILVCVREVAINSYNGINGWKCSKSLRNFCPISIASIAGDIGWLRRLTFLARTLWALREHELTANTVVCAFPPSKYGYKGVFRAVFNANSSDFLFSPLKSSFRFCSTWICSHARLCEVVWIEFIAKYTVNSRSQWRIFLFSTSVHLQVLSKECCKNCKAVSTEFLTCYSVVTCHFLFFGGSCFQSTDYTSVGWITLDSYSERRWRFS